MFIGFYNILVPKLEHLEINHSLRYDEREKPRPTVENHSGSRPLFTELEVTHLTFKKIDNC
jgi:hypothetical protein